MGNMDVDYVFFYAWCVYEGIGSFDVEERG